MSTSKYFDKICLAVTVITLIITLLFMNGERLGIRVVVNEDAEANSDSVYFTKKDLKGSWNSSVTTNIRLEDDDAHISGAGAYFYKGVLHITASGYYELRGTLSSGQIIVEAGKNDQVWLKLNGVSISCPDDACIKIINADKVFLTLEADSENSLTSGAQYSSEAEEEGCDGVIYSHDDLTINGKGSLTVTTAYKHGIVSNDALIITGGKIKVTAAGSAIRANENLRICRADLTIISENKGIVVDDEESFLYIESGSLVIKTADDAIRCKGDINIVGGSLTLTAGDDAIQSDTKIDITGGEVSILYCNEKFKAPKINVAEGVVTS